MIAFEFTSFTIFAALFLLFQVTIGRLIPTLRRSGSAAMLMMSCLPWLSPVVVPLFVLFDRMS